MHKYPEGEPITIEIFMTGDGELTEEKIIEGLSKLEMGYDLAMIRTPQSMRYFPRFKNANDT